MAKLILKLVSILPLAAVVILVNYTTDPSHLFHRVPRGTEFETEKQIVDRLLSGRSVAVSAYDDRLVQRLYIERLPHKKDVIVLGSSRTMGLRSNDFPQHAFFNNSVGAGLIADFMAIYSLYERRHLEPDTVVLDVDPWNFNRNSDLAFTRSLHDDYAWMARRIDLQTSLDSQVSTEYAEWLQVLSPTYFQTAIKARLAYARRHLLADGSGSPPLEPLDGAQLLFADGSHRPEKKMLKRPIADVRRDAASLATDRPIIGLASFWSLDENVVKSFERFIDFLQQRGRHVVLLLAPYHPLPYAVIRSSPEYRGVLEAERYLESLAERKNLDIAGSYDPAACGCSENEFFDGVHPRHRCMSKILKETRSGASNFVMHRSTD